MKFDSFQEQLEKTLPARLFNRSMKTAADVATDGFHIQEKVDGEYTDKLAIDMDGNITITGELVSVPKINLAEYGYKENK